MPNTSEGTRVIRLSGVSGRPSGDATLNISGGTIGGRWKEKVSLRRIIGTSFGPVVLKVERGICYGQASILLTILNSDREFSGRFFTIEITDRGARSS